jgi:hypothetical protein
MLTVVRLWILLSTLLVSAGWILSALHQLNRIGYGAILQLPESRLFLATKTKWRQQKNPAQLYYKFSRRFKRLAPMFFLLLVLLDFLIRLN